MPTVNGMWAELNAFVDMVFAQPETAKNLCRRLYRYFVSRNISDEIENEIIVPLSNTLIANNFEVKPVLEQLLQSEHFFDTDDSDNADEIIGGIIKSPLELTLQALTFFDVAMPDPLTQNTAHYIQFSFPGIAGSRARISQFSDFQPLRCCRLPRILPGAGFSTAVVQFEHHHCPL